MATDEEIDRFVADNRDLIERMMEIQMENARTASLFGRDLAVQMSESAVEAACMVRERSEEFFRETLDTISDPVVQRHFMDASMEFLAGLTALVEAAPMPDFVRTAASDFKSNARSAACRANKDCPLRKKAITPEPAKE